MDIVRLWNKIISVSEDELIIFFFFNNKSQEIPKSNRSNVHTAYKSSTKINEIMLKINAQNYTIKEIDYGNKN